MHLGDMALALITNIVCRSTMTVLYVLKVSKQNVRKKLMFVIAIYDVIYI